MIQTIKSYLPDSTLSNDQLSLECGCWTSTQIHQKTGISTRRIAGASQYASDLMREAARRLLDLREAGTIDFLVACTQTPDYLLPATACLVHGSLGLDVRCGAFDINLGCSGYVYGLAVCHSLISEHQAQRILLLTGDTYSKIIRESDFSTRTIFGDAGTATLLDGGCSGRLHSFVFGTDGGGADQLIARRSGMRGRMSKAMKRGKAPESREEGPRSLAMNGPEVFNFTLQRVPKLVDDVLTKAGFGKNDVDYFVFHQANAFMLEHLRRKLLIPTERFVVALEQCGNTVSGSIPLALEGMLDRGLLRQGSRVLLAGFGVGLSWAGCIWECGVVN